MARVAADAAERLRELTLCGTRFIQGWLMQNAPPRNLPEVQVQMTVAIDPLNAINQKLETGGKTAENWIRIETYAREGQVMLTVSDTGIGMDTSLKERIFEAFFTTKKMGEGMGLGLSITNGIVEDYGGKITIESAEGQGTTFQLSFPAAR